MFKPLRLRGLIAAPYTPLYADGSLHIDVITSMADLLIESGVSGVFVGGSTGEGMSLTVDERQALTIAWVKAIRKRAPTIVHVGHNSLFDSITLARHAEAYGADAISSLAPSYYKPRRSDDLIAFLAAVANAAPSLPFYYYHIPGMTGVTTPVAELLKQGSKRIPNLNGVKFSHSDLMELQECLGLSDGRFDIVFGMDEMLLAALALGVNGAVGATYNFAAPLYVRILEAFAAGDLERARREQRKSVELVRILYDVGLIRAGKMIMSMLGIDCGPVRLPLEPMDADETEKLLGRIAHLDVFPKPVQLPRQTPSSAKSKSQSRPFAARAVDELPLTWCD